jgi:NTE family protein
MSVARSRNPSIRDLEAALDQAVTYADWKEAALAHDEISGAAIWKKQDRSSRYGYPGVRRRLDLLRRLRDDDDAQELLFYLNEGIHGNIDGIGKPAMYNVARFGTKDLISSYLGELESAIHRLAEVDDEVIPFADRLDFFRRASHCYGRSALMLSGGGSLGPFHLGVARALFEQDLLPTVISGSSAGAFVAGILGTHTDAELEELLGNETMVEVSTGPVGRRMSIEDVREAVSRLVPDMTFQEAFERTGRKINISVAPSEVHQTSRLLNAITSPNVFIREAVLASCAIPGIFPPVMLAARDASGQRKAYLPARRWVDGSVSDDLPAKRLTRLYGVNHFITSMINPVVLWSVRDPDWEDSMFLRFWDISQKAYKEFLRATYPLTMQAVRRTYPLNLAVRMWYSVVTQDYTADINIIPKKRFWNPAKLLHVLSEDDTRALVREGEKATWPRIEMIRNCTRISRTLDRILDGYEHEYANRYTHTHARVARTRGPVLVTSRPAPPTAPADTEDPQSSSPGHPGAPSSN